MSSKIQCQVTGSVVNQFSIVFSLFVAGTQVGLPLNEHCHVFQSAATNLETQVVVAWMASVGALCSIIALLTGVIVNRYPCARVICILHLVGFVGAAVLASHASADSVYLDPGYFWVGSVLTMPTACGIVVASATLCARTVPIPARTGIFLLSGFAFIVAAVVFLGLTHVGDVPIVPPTCVSILTILGALSTLFMTPTVVPSVMQRRSLSVQSQQQQSPMPTGVLLLACGGLCVSGMFTYVSYSIWAVHVAVPTMGYSQTVITAIVFGFQVGFALIIFPIASCAARVVSDRVLLIVFVCGVVLGGIVQWINNPNPIAAVYQYGAGSGVIAISNICLIGVGNSLFSKLMTPGKQGLQYGVLVVAQVVAVICGDIYAALVMIQFSNQTRPWVHIAPLVLPVLAGLVLLPLFNRMVPCLYSPWYATLQHGTIRQRLHACCCCWNHRVAMMDLEREQRPQELSVALLPPSSKGKSQFFDQLD